MTPGEAEELILQRAHLIFDGSRIFSKYFQDHVRIRTEIQRTWVNGDLQLKLILKPTIFMPPDRIMMTNFVMELKRV